MKVTLLFLLILTAGCSTSFEGIRMRAQAPPLQEGARRLSLALRADNYQLIESAGPGIETGWRRMTDSEKGKDEKGPILESQISAQLYQRGSLYDIFIIIRIRSGEEEYIPRATHPLVEKWQKILGEIVQEEFREEG